MSPRVQREKPPYRQIADYFKQLIMDGKLAPGDSIMSERQIASEWGVSRATATKALAVLRSEGLAEARQGSGTVVTGTRSLYQSIHERYGTVRRTGRIYTPGQYAKIIDASLVEAPAEVAEALDLEPGAMAIRRHRVTYDADHHPLACSTSWFAGDLADVAPLLLETARIRQGTAAYVEEMTGRRMSRGQDRIAARLATAEELAELALPEPSAVLVTLHTVWDTEGQPLSYEEGIAPPERWTTYDYPISDS